jgi:hypothetical protein
MRCCGTWRKVEIAFVYLDQRADGAGAFACADPLPMCGEDQNGVGVEHHDRRPTCRGPSPARPGAGAVARTLSGTTRSIIAVTAASTVRGPVEATSHSPTSAEWCLRQLHWTQAVLLKEPGGRRIPDLAVEQRRSPYGPRLPPETVQTRGVHLAA